LSVVLRGCEKTQRGREAAPRAATPVSARPASGKTNPILLFPRAHLPPLRLTSSSRTPLMRRSCCPSGVGRRSSSATSSHARWCRSSVSSTTTPSSSAMRPNHDVDRRCARSRGLPRRASSAAFSTAVGMALSISCASFPPPPPEGKNEGAEGTRTAMGTISCSCCCCCSSWRGEGDGGGAYASASSARRDARARDEKRDAKATGGLLFEGGAPEEGEGEGAKVCLEDATVACGGGAAGRLRAHAAAAPGACATRARHERNTSARGGATAVPADRILSLFLFLRACVACVVCVWGCVVGSRVL